jgi:hypothetical protein
MNAVHIRTDGLRGSESTELVERTVTRLPGVAQALSVESLAVTSVLYDPVAVSPGSIALAIRSLGLGAEVVEPHRVGVLDGAGSSHVMNDDLAPAGAGLGR